MFVQTIYDFILTALDGSEIDFSRFKGKNILIVNTASRCGYTHQYADLQSMYERHKDDLVIIGVPSNNFLWQEPGSNADILEFCSSKYDVTFPMSIKTSVKGRKIHPLFKWLTNHPNPDFTGNVKWNFEKFLFDKEGNLIRRFRSKVKPDEIEKFIYG